MTILLVLTLLSAVSIFYVLYLCYKFICAGRDGTYRCESFIGIGCKWPRRLFVWPKITITFAFQSISTSKLPNAILKTDFKSKMICAVFH